MKKVICANCGAIHSNILCPKCGSVVNYPLNNTK